MTTIIGNYLIKSFIFGNFRKKNLLSNGCRFVSKVHQNHNSEVQSDQNTGGRIIFDNSPIFGQIGNDPEDYAMVIG